MISEKRGGVGFTLLELIITIGIMSILAAVALPKFAQNLMKAQEGQTKGNMGSLRSAISIYYGDNFGNNPACVGAGGPNDLTLNNSLVPNYIASIPTLNNGLHPPTNAVYCDVAIAPGNVHDGNGWYYDGVGQDSQNGSLWVACAHTDTKGTVWSTY